jgi:hypothetical protein
MKMRNVLNKKRIIYLEGRAYILEGTCKLENNEHSYIKYKVKGEYIAMHQKKEETTRLDQILDKLDNEYGMKPYILFNECRDMVRKVDEFSKLINSLDKKDIKNSFSEDVKNHCLTLISDSTQDCIDNLNFTLDNLEILKD